MFPSIFKQTAEKDDEEGKDGRAEESGNDNEGEHHDDEGNAKGNVDPFVWMTMIENVSDVTKLNFNQVYDMSATDFFSYVLYCNMKIDKENERIKNFQNGIK